jgi:hypothetical protein
MQGLPDGDLKDKGLADLPRGEEAAEPLPVSIASRLRALGVAFEAPEGLRPATTLATTLLNRFFSIYFLVYVVATQMLGAMVALPGIDIPELGEAPPFRWLVEWTAPHVFGVTGPLVSITTGSGDRTFDWVLSFCLMVLAAIATLIWFAVSRREHPEAAWPRWFRVFLRCALGASFFMYGASKVIPLQMPFPFLTRLLEPYGHFSPMGVLWASIGASPAYEIFTGCAEVAAGVLLFIPATQLLGALVSLTCAIQIFTLNMTYDIPVKLFSFHLVLMSLFLIAPEASRLLNVLVLNRRAEPSLLVPVGRTPRARRIATWLQIAYGACLLTMNLYNSTEAYKKYGGAREKPPFFGIWNVVATKVDRVDYPMLVTEGTCWRRIVFDFPGRVSVQLMNDGFMHFTSKIDPERKSMTLSKGGGSKWGATLSVEPTTPERMTLSGLVDGRQTEMRLELFPRENFLMVNRGFNWI